MTSSRNIPNLHVYIGFRVMAGGTGRKGHRRLASSDNRLLSELQYSGVWQGVACFYREIAELCSFITVNNCSIF